MEAERTNGVAASADEVVLNESVWVSPEVAAAEAGEPVEMGKELPSNEELEAINNQI